MFGRKKRERRTPERRQDAAWLKEIVRECEYLSPPSPEVIAEAVQMWDGRYAKEAADKSRLLTAIDAQVLELAKQLNGLIADRERRKHKGYGATLADVRAQYSDS